MGVIYQLTFFLALGLLAIVITIFVFAVAQLGRATEVSSRQQQDILLKQKEAKTKQIGKIEKQVTKAKKTGDLDEAKLLQELQSLREESAKYGTELKHIEEKLERLQVKGGVLRPGAFFLTTLILSGLAVFLAGGQNHIAIPLWSVSIAALCYGGWEVYKNLKVIEEVTTTSQEAIEKLPEVVKALRELEEEKKPKLELKFEDAQPPFHVEADSEMTLKFKVLLIKGEVAESVGVHFVVPPGFDFPHQEKTYTLTSDHDYPNYIGTIWRREEAISGLEYHGTMVIKSSSKVGSFKIIYFIFCKGFQTKPTELEIIVK